MYKKLICTIVMLGVLTTSSMAYAAGSVKILVKNEPIQTEGQPIIEKGRVLIPLRAVAESLGVTVSWNQQTKTATVRKWAESAHLTVGKNKALVEGKPNGDSTTSIVELDATVKNVNNRVYIPLRFIARQFGYRVEWSNNTVFIKSPLRESDQNTLYQGDLATSRELAQKLSFFDEHYQHEPLLITYRHENYDRTYLFPEGEALRFYVIEGDTVSFHEFKEDFLLVTWQAHLQKVEEEPLKLFLENKLTDERGTAPKINKAFFYYSTGIFGDRNFKECGSIDIDQKRTQTGYRRTVGGTVTNETGTIELKLPGEKRVDGTGQ